MSNRKNKKSSYSGDLTLSDFADSKYIHFRPKKSDLTKPAKMAEVERAWDDDDDDDLDLDLVEQENEDGTKSLVVERKSRKSRRKGENLFDTEEDEGIEYPVAIWFLISEYIKPEDVGTFSQICKGALFVTGYAKFWHDLHKNYCKPISSLPDELKPKNLVRRYGLRVLVIRSLFYTYPLFKDRKPVQEYSTPQELLKRRCSGMWYESEHKDRWVFFFKMKLVNNPLYRSQQKSVKKKDWLTILDDILANTEEDCKILKIVCGRFSDAPLTLGMTLRLLQTSLAPNMRSQRLTLGFSSGYQEKPDYIIVLDRVVKVQVLDWWQPLYPHSGENLPSSIMGQIDGENNMWNVIRLFEDCS